MIADTISHGLSLLGISLEISPTWYGVPGITVMPREYVSAWKAMMGKLGVEQAHACALLRLVRQASILTHHQRGSYNDWYRIAYSALATHLAITDGQTDSGVSQQAARFKRLAGR